MDTIYILGLNDEMLIEGLPITVFEYIGAAQKVRKNLGSVMRMLCSNIIFFRDQDFKPVPWNGFHPGRPHTFVDLPHRDQSVAQDIEMIRCAFPGASSMELAIQCFDNKYSVYRL